MKTIRIRTQDNDVRKLEKKLGVTLMAKRADGTVNGYVNYIQDGSRYIAEIALYEEDKEPDFELYEYKGVLSSKGSAITIRKSAEGLKRLE